MRKVAISLLAGLILGACGASTQRWTFGDYAISVPSNWRVQAEPDENGFNIVEPATGIGLIAFIEIGIKQPPDTITDAYALEEGRKGIASTGLPPEAATVERLAEGHFLVSASGEGHGEHVVAVVHVLSPDTIVVGFFHSPDAADPAITAATQVLRSVTPSG